MDTLAVDFYIVFQNMLRLFEMDVDFKTASTLSMPASGRLNIQQSYAFFGIWTN